jgi:hypothetical protein
MTQQNGYHNGQNGHTDGHTNGQNDHNDASDLHHPGGKRPNAPGLEPVHVKSLSVTYERKFNLGNYESLTAAVTIWARVRVPTGLPYNLHDCKRRVRQMARNNVRAQWERVRGKETVVFLGLPPPADGSEDPLLVHTASVSLVYKVNLGDYNSVAPGYTDWADLRGAAGPGALHLALDRMWRGLWANLEDEIGRARGQARGEGFFGLPQIPVEDLTAVSTNGDGDGNRRDG